MKHCVYVNKHAHAQPLHPYLLCGMGTYVTLPLCQEQQKQKQKQN